MRDVVKDESMVHQGMSEPAARVDAPPGSMAVAPATTLETMERLLAAAKAGENEPPAQRGIEHLAFACDEVLCALPLRVLREVLRTLPETVPLPGSPSWLLGIFPLRAEIVALVDPGSILLGRPTVTMPAGKAAGRAGAPALVVGEGERAVAWLVRMVGAIVPIDEDEVRQPTMSAGLPISPRYLAGVYEQPHAGERIFVLRPDVLIDDMLAACAEGGADHG